MRVLVVEDDNDVAAGLKRVLEREGFVADRAADGDQGDYLLRTERYDAVVLDLGLPMRDGLSLLRDWREAGISVPVLILTARGRWPEKAAGFEAGADDYVTKPFEPLEVAARLHALIRRSHGQANAVWQFGAVTLDSNRGEVSENGMPVTLTPHEYRLLAYLALASDRIVSRTELSEHLYARDTDPDSNVIDVLVSRIRRKLDTPLIETVRGQGFMIRAR